MNRRIIEARKIYSKAIEEFERGMMYNDRIIIRDSAEKAWLSAVKAIDALIDSEGYEICILMHYIVGHTNSISQKEYYGKALIRAYPKLSEL
ncbi:MAG: hypothetical protein ACE5J3_04200 [Methanosarcinales archaeon]